MTKAPAKSRGLCPQAQELGFDIPERAYLGGRKLRKGVKAGKDAKIAVLGIAERGDRVHQGAFSLFKRGVIGSYHHLSKDHLDRYLQEFSWRFNRRGMQPIMFGEMLRELVTKKPMTYRHLTREVF